MRKLVSFMHLSLDGYVAGPKGEMNWITVNEDLFEFSHEQASQADVALYGRVTYQMMDAYWPTAADKPNASKHDVGHSNWYNAVDKVVLSKTIKDGQRPKTTFIGDSVAERIGKLKAAEGKNIVMFGSPGAVRSLVSDDLIDDFWLFINPIILGKGKRYWPELHNAVKLKLVLSKTIMGGIVAMHYQKA